MARAAARHIVRGRAGCHMLYAMNAPAAHDRAFFGHPRGLSTLFFTEMWERFSYYGMRALLILFMTAPLATGGLGFDTATAGAVYGLYTSMVYMTTLPGGWIADRLIGQRRAVLYGGILIASGHFSMAFPSLATFYLGLVPHRHRHRPPQGQRQRHRRSALWRQGHAARCRLLHLLHGDQSRRLHRPAHLRLPRPARQLAHGLRGRRRRHGARRHSVPAGREVPRRRRPRAGAGGIP